MRFSEYTPAEEEHAEMAVEFSDHVRVFIDEHKLSREQILVLLNDEIKQQNYEEENEKVQS